MITTKVIRGDSLMEMTKISKIMTLSSEEKEVLTLVLSSTGGKDIMMTNTAMMIKSKLTTARESSTSSTKSQIALLRNKTLINHHFTKGLRITSGELSKMCSALVMTAQIILRQRFTTLGRIHSAVRTSHVITIRMKTLINMTAPMMNRRCKLISGLTRRNVLLREKLNVNTMLTIKVMKNQLVMMKMTT